MHKVSITSKPFWLACLGCLSKIKRSVEVDPSPSPLTFKSSVIDTTAANVVMRDEDKAAAQVRLPEDN